MIFSYTQGRTFTISAQPNIIHGGSSEGEMNEESPLQSHVYSYPSCGASFKCSIVLASRHHTGYCRYLYITCRWWRGDWWISRGQIGTISRIGRPAKQSRGLNEMLHVNAGGSGTEDDAGSSLVWVDNGVLVAESPQKNLCDYYSSCSDVTREVLAAEETTVPMIQSCHYTGTWKKHHTVLLPKMACIL